MDMDIEIRDALPSDAQAYHDIYHHYVKPSIATLQLSLPTLSESLSKFTRLRTSTLPFLVAVDPSSSDSRIAGLAYADTFNERGGYHHTVEGTIYLHPDFCGRGIGKVLLEILLDRLRELGKRVVVAKMSILPGQKVGEHASCRLHLGMGFREVGRLVGVGEKLGLGVDVVFLQMEVGGEVREE